MITCEFFKDEDALHVQLHDREDRRIYCFERQLLKESFEFDRLAKEQNKVYNQRAEVVARHIVECLRQPENMAKLTELLNTRAVKGSED